VTAQIGAPYIPLPPANKDDIRAIPASLALMAMAENKVLLHPCFYSFLLTSIDFPATTEDHTVYDAFYNTSVFPDITFHKTTQICTTTQLLIYTFQTQPFLFLQDLHIKS
jgi:hypothetical protein